MYFFMPLFPVGNAPCMHIKNAHGNHAVVVAILPYICTLSNCCLCVGRAHSVTWPYNVRQCPLFITLCGCLLMGGTRAIYLSVVSRWKRACYQTGGRTLATCAAKWCDNATVMEESSHVGVVRSYWETRMLKEGHRTLARSRTRGSHVGDPPII